MAGHSKWSNIKRTKEAQDKKRASIFTKISKDITTAVKLGETGDPEFNPMLKVSIDKAKAANMPNDKIEKAINRGLGITDSDEVITENTYEFYGPEGTAFIVDVETDNPNRVITELKVLANKIGLKMASEGSISWQFEELGLIVLTLSDDSKNLEDLVLELFEIEGIIDTERDEESKSVVITTEKNNLKKVFDDIKAKIEGINIEKAELIKSTDAVIEVDDKTLEKAQNIYESFEELDDVSNIWTNF